MVTREVLWLAVTTVLTVGLPAQANDTVDEPLPPLKMLTLFKTLALTKLKLAETVDSFKKETLLVLKLPQGPERYHLLLPQSAVPVGY